MLAVIGSSGGGKTTLLRCLNFLEIPDAGELYLNGEKLFDAAELGKKAVKDIRKKRLHFGLVFQSFNLFPQYTVFQNITLAQNLLDKENFKNRKKEFRALLKAYEPDDRKEKKREFRALLKECAPEERKDKKKEFRAILNAYDPEVWKVKKKEKKEEQKRVLQEIRSTQKARAEEKANSLLDRVGLTEKRNAYPYELSGGQQQRVAIARALALNPDILCFDEPTSALDPELTGEVLKVIKGLKSSDSTMIVVTHEMEFARNVADLVIFMADGVIEEMGTPAEVFDFPKSDKTRAFLQKSLEQTL